MQRFPKLQLLKICSKNIKLNMATLFVVHIGRTYCWHCQSALSATKESEITFELDKIDRNFTISRWSRALIRSSSLRFASTARDISSFMSSASGLPRIMSIIPGSRFLFSTGGRSVVAALSRGVEFSIDHLRRDCIVSYPSQAG